ncbi:hypothetical protein [Acinetobacter sp. WZC-1]|uniref:hypothetical protein n=1 Tax=Acinetobacter sp. WZC-1 TaxID=3459034 RepID=UPI00403D8A63
MAFDLVQYFTEQIKLQKPQLLSQYSAEDRQHYFSEINALSLGRLITLWRKDDTRIYQEIHAQDHLYIQEIARHLTTSGKNESSLPKAELEQASTEILSLQFAELKQLDETGHFGQNGMRELLLGQIEHLSGQAGDWVWSTNELSELIGSQPVVTEELSLDESMKEFNQMINQQPDLHSETHHAADEVLQPEQPVWSKIAEPVVALIVLLILWNALQHIF